MLSSGPDRRAHTHPHPWLHQHPVPSPLRSSRLATGRIHLLTTDAPATGWSALPAPPATHGLVLCRALAYWFTPRFLVPGFSLAASGQATVVHPFHGPRPRA